MPKNSKEQEDYFKSRIRSVLIINPRSSLREIQKVLDNAEPPLHLSLEYMGKLVRKVIKERSYRNNTLLVNARLATIQDKIAMIDQRLWKVVADEMTSKKDLIHALKTLAQNEMNLFQAELDAGLYNRQVGTIKVEEKKLQVTKIIQQLDPDDRSKIIGAFKELLNIRGGNAGNVLPVRPAVFDREGNISTPQQEPTPQLEAGQAPPRVERSD